jgi:methylenetetrahydrofolate reductase (NADPH)
MPIDPPDGWEPNALLAKAKAGAQFVQTQFCMDAAIVRRYVGVLEKAGVSRSLSILIGVNPLRSAKSAQWMKRHLYGTIIPDALIARLEKAADPAREGMRICVELIEELSNIRGVAGVHVMAPGNDGAIAEVIGEAKGRLGKIPRP